MAQKQRKKTTRKSSASRTKGTSKKKPSSKVGHKRAEAPWSSKSREENEGVNQKDLMRWSRYEENRIIGDKNRWPLSQNLRG